MENPTPRSLSDEEPEFVGERVGGDPFDDQEHFYLCHDCGQPVDMRDLGAVMHHEALGHHRLPAPEAVILIPASDLRPEELIRRIEDRLRGGERDFRSSRHGRIARARQRHHR
jgi:hypothetical protein